MSIQEFTTYQLQSMTRAEEDLYLLLGQKIFDRGKRFPEEFGQTLDKAGVRSVFAVPKADVEDFKFKAINQLVDLDAKVLRRDGKLSQSLYNKRGELILKSGGMWTSKMAVRLRNQGDLTIYLRRTDEKIAQDEANANRLLELVSRLKVPEPTEEEALHDLRDDFQEIDSSTCTVTGMDSLGAQSDEHSIPDDAHALQDHIKNHDIRVARSEMVKTRMVDSHRQWIRDLRFLMEAIALRSDVDTRLLSGMCRNTMGALVEDKDLLLNLNMLEHDKLEDFVFCQSVNSTIITVNIATAMRYSAQQIYEMSFGAFLHDIGMLKVPPEILFKSGRLSDAERSEIYKHPIYALDMLQRLKKIPVVTALIAYQTHERGDKTGYPRRRALTGIHRYSRIVCIADVYCAMTARRPHRTSHSPYAAMEYMTREAVQGRMDRDALKAFMSINSLYPVGSWVILDDQRIGKIIAANSQSYDRPAMRVFYQGTARLSEPETLDLAAPENEARRVIKTFDGSRLKVGVMDGF